MAKIPVRPPNTPREVKAAKSAIHQLEKRSAKIRRDIMNRRVDNLSEARRIAATQSAKAKELRIDLQNSPAIKYSKRNKYMRYRMPTKVRPIRRQRRRRVPLRRSIQASIAAKNNRLQQSKAAKPFNVAKPSPKPPQIKRVVRRSPRRGYVRRMPQSPVRKARSIIKRPSRMSRMFKRMSRRTRSPSKRRALSQEASVQARNAKVAQSQLNKNRLQQQNARIAMMRRRYLEQQKQRASRSRVGPTPKDARRIISRSSRRQTYVIPSKSGKPMRVSKPVYDRYMAARKASMDRMRARRGTVRRPIVRRTPSRINRPRPKAVAIQNQQKVKQEIERRKAFAAQQARLRNIAARRSAAKMKSDSISQQRLRMLKANISKSRSAAVLQAKQLEEHLAKVRAKQQSVANRLSPIKSRISTYRRSFKLGEANLGAIRRDDTLADNHRDNMQELSKLENEANSLGAIARKLKQQEMNLQGELQVVSDQIGNLNPSRLYQENKENLSETKSLEKCLSNKLMELNQSGHVSGEGINKAKAIIRQFDKRQIPFDEAKTRIYRTLKQAHTPKGGDMIKRDVAGMQQGINEYEKYFLAMQGMEFSAAGKESLRKLVNKYAVGQIKTKQEAEAQFMQIVGNPRFVQKKVTIAELGHARALGIAATIRSRKSKQLPAVRQLTAERRAFYDKQRIAEEERLKKSQERVENRQSLAGIFPRTRSAMERMTR
tara:strand:+ start:2366 stop:4510 length:2145 start_codon:yes stop_codon:yes gene_type:complete